MEYEKLESSLKCNHRITNGLKLNRTVIDHVLKSELIAINVMHKTKHPVSNFLLLFESEVLKVIIMNEYVLYNNR